MGLLSLLLCFTMMMTQPANIIEELRTPEKVVTIVQTSEEVEHVAAAEEEPPAPAMHLYGNCRITFYCPCSACCGSWGNATASGAMPQANHTVACGDLPFGTRLLIDGQEYVVEDRGVGAQQVDIFVNDHGEALARGLYYTDVWILEG